MKMPMLKIPFTKFYVRLGWLRRIDRFAAELNLPLVVLAIGLAALDVTVLVAQHVVDALPPMIHAAAPVDPPGSPRNLADGFQ